MSEIVIVSDRRRHRYLLNRGRNRSAVGIDNRSLGQGALVLAKQGRPAEKPAALRLQFAVAQFA
jgi:hypothetical protein